MPARTRRSALGLLPGLALAALAAPAAALAGPQPDGEIGIGQALPDARLRGLNGPSRTLADYRGQALVINVWASWCGPCRQEMASLERLAWREQVPPLRIIGISTDDDPRQALALLARTNATISHFIDEQLLWEHLLGASTLPLTVLVDAQGHVRDKVHGAQEWDGPQALARIARALGRPGVRSPAA